jgi:hypothetical protein
MTYEEAQIIVQDNQWRQGDSYKGQIITFITAIPTYKEALAKIAECIDNGVSLGAYNEANVEKDFTVVAWLDYHKRKKGESIKVVSLESILNNL